MKQHPHRNIWITFHLSIYLYKTISAVTPLEITDWPSRGALPASYVSWRATPRHCLPCWVQPPWDIPASSDLACHTEWSQCERKTCHGEIFTCKFFHCMPHPDLACRTEFSNHEIFNCQFSVMVCHTLTLPVLLSAASWFPMKNRLLMTTYIWNLPARGENTFIQWSSTTFSSYTKQTF